jgi:hypothetical protein
MLAAVVVVDVILFAAGVWLVSWTLLSAIRTVILPRSAQSFIGRVVFRAIRYPFDWLAHERVSFERRDRIMALYGPIGLVALPGVWLTLVVFGYMLAFFATGDRSMGEALHLSGSSITTLGFAPADTLVERVLAFTEAGWGLFLVALMITYLPSLYQAFARRETMVAILEVRAGSPPSATEFIERHFRIGWLDDLGATWLEWERWFAEVEESHTSFPALVFFRSPDPGRHWLTAAGTILDSASLIMAAVPGTSVGPSGVCVRSGYLALRRIADFFGIEFDPAPAPTDPISITRAEFDDAMTRLREIGVPLTSDDDEAWRDYAGWRVNYDTVLLQLAEITMAPYAPWTSDRSAVNHARPKVRRFGRKRARSAGRSASPS